MARDPDAELLGRPIRKWGNWYAYVRNDAGRLVLERTSPPPDTAPRCWCTAPVVAQQTVKDGEVTYVTRCVADRDHIWHLPDQRFSDQPTTPEGAS